VAKNVLTREEHHKKKPFKVEYLEILKNNNVEFKEEYMFEFFNNIYGWD
jgi:putative transposase